MTCLRNVSFQFEPENSACLNLLIQLFCTCYDDFKSDSKGRVEVFLAIRQLLYNENALKPNIHGIGYFTSGIRFYNWISD